MPRIDVPAGRDPLLHLWSGIGNKLTGPAAAFSGAVYRKSTLAPHGPGSPSPRPAAVNG